MEPYNGRFTHVHVHIQLGIQWVAPFKTVSGGAGDQTSNLPINQTAILPPESWCPLI